MFTSNAVGRGNVFSRAAKVLNVILVDIGQGGVAIASFTVVFVDLSGVTVAIASEVNQEDEDNQQDEGEDEESDSPTLVINQESNERDNGDDDTQNEKSSDVPEGEEGFDLGDSDNIESNVGVEDHSKGKDQEESSSQEDQV